MMVQKTSIGITMTITLVHRCLQPAVVPRARTRPSRFIRMAWPPLATRATETTQLP